MKGMPTVSQKACVTWAGFSSKSSPSVAKGVLPWMASKAAEAERGVAQKAMILRIAQDSSVSSSRP